MGFSLSTHNVKAELKCPPASRIEVSGWGFVDGCGADLSTGGVSGRHAQADGGQVVARSGWWRQVIDAAVAAAAAGLRARGAVAALQTCAMAAAMSSAES